MKPGPIARLVLLGLIAVAACAPRVQEEGARMAEPRLGEGAFVAGDGREMPLRVWPANPETRAVVVAVHGFNDYSNAFAGPAAWWATRGVTTYAYDQRGFGAGAEPGIWGGSGAMVRDLGEVVAAVRARHPGAPLYLLGHSMGCAVVVAALAEGRVGAVEGVVLVAPALWGQETLNPFYRAALWLGAHTMPFKHLTGRGLGIRASDNDEMLKALSRDELFIKETRIDSIYGLVGLMDRSLARAGEARARLLVLYGEHEEVVPEGAARGLLERLARPYRLAAYPEGWHMLLRDLQRETVWRDIEAWLRDGEAPLPSGHERESLPPFVKD